MGVEGDFQAERRRLQVFQTRRRRTVAALRHGSARGVPTLSGGVTGS